MPAEGPEITVSLCPNGCVTLHVGPAVIHLSPQAFRRLAHHVARVAPDAWRGQGERVERGLA